MIRMRSTSRTMEGPDRSFLQKPMMHVFFPLLSSRSMVGILQQVSMLAFGGGLLQIGSGLPSADNRLSQILSMQFVMPNDRRRKSFPCNTRIPRNWHWTWYSDSCWTRSIYIGWLTSKEDEVVATLGHLVHTIPSPTSSICSCSEVLWQTRRTAFPFVLLVFLYFRRNTPHRMTISASPDSVELSDAVQDVSSCAHDGEGRKHSLPV